MDRKDALAQGRAVRALDGVRKVRPLPSRQEICCYCPKWRSGRDDLGATLVDTCPSRWIQAPTVEPTPTLPSSSLIPKQSMRPNKQYTYKLELVGWATS